MSKSYPNKRDCEHGWLRRSCPYCEANEDMKRIEQLGDSNKELLSALEWIVSEIKDCAQPEDWESFDACEKAITNAKQVKG